MTTTKQFTVGDIARQVGAILHGDGSIIATGVSSLSTLAPGTIVFAERERDIPRAMESQAAAVIVKSLPEQTGTPAMLQSSQVRHTFAQVCQLFFPGFQGEPPGVHPTAIVDPSATLGEDVAIGPYVVIGANVTIGARTVLRAGVIVDNNVCLGADCHIFPGCVIGRDSTIGDRCIFHAHVIIGSDGFGFTEDIETSLKQPQFGRVIIGNDCEFGANTCVDRGTLDDTVLGDDVKLDNLVQVGHNCQLGNHIRIAALCGLAGGVEIEDYCIIGGMTGFANRVKIGRGSLIGGQSGVTRNIPPGSQYWGLPARNHRDALKELVLMQRLPEIVARLDALEGDVRGLPGTEEEDVEPLT